MRAIGAASATLLGVAAFALAAPAAAAADHAKITPFGYSVNPTTVAAGGTVRLALTGCGTPATVSSGVFDTASIPSGRTVTATVRREAKAGATYPVTFTCGGVSGTTNLTISGATRPTSGVTPGGVQGGFGGSVGGMNTAEIVAGTALVVVAATGIIYAARRRADGRRH